MPVTRVVFNDLWCIFIVSLGTIWPLPVPGTVWNCASRTDYESPPHGKQSQRDARSISEFPKDDPSYKDLWSEGRGPVPHFVPRRVAQWRKLESRNWQQSTVKRTYPWHGDGFPDHVRRCINRPAETSAPLPFVPQKENGSRRCKNPAI